MSAFDLSYRALEPEHQQFFRRLGVSPCAGVSLHAAAALAGCTLAEAEKALAALLDHHLLARASAVSSASTTSSADMRRCGRVMIRA